MVNFILTITVQYLFYQSAKKYLKELYIILFFFIENNNLLTPNQSGFCPNDSCVNQLLPKVHRIYSDFGQNLSL